MIKYLKYIFISIAILVAVLAISGVVISVFFGEQVQRLAIKELNKGLATEVKLNGPVKLSIFKNFPNASLTFYEVEIRESYEGSENNMAEAEEISLIFSMWDIVRGKYTIQKIHLANGNIDLLVNKDGKANYIIWKETEGDDSGSEDLKLMLQHARMEKMNIRYADETMPQRYEVFINDGTLSGEFSNTRFTLTTDLDMLTKEIYVKGMDYFPNSPATLAMDIDIDTEKEIYKFQSGNIKIGKDNYKVDGVVMMEEKGTNLDILVEGKNISLQSLIAVLPEDASRSLEQFDSKGTLYFKAAINGIASSTANPHMRIDFGLENGRITHTAMKQDIKNVTFSGTFDNGSRNSAATTSLKIPSFRATLDGKPLTFQLALNDLENPYIDLKATADIDLKLLAPVVASKDLTGLTGSAVMKDIAVKGRVRDMQMGRNISGITSTGNVVLEDVNFLYLKKSFSGINGNFDLRSNELIIRPLELIVDGSDIALEGSINNILTFIANVAQSEEVPVLDVDLKLNSKVLDMDRLFAYEYAEPAATDAGTEANYLYPFRMFSGRLDAEVERLNWDNFDATLMKGTFALSPESINIQSLLGRTVNGAVTVSGTLKVEQDEWLVLTNKANLKNIDVNRLFTSFDNFGQEVMKAEHINGELSANVNYTLYWDKQLNFISDRMVMVADLSIRDGQLVNFEPLNDLSAYVKLSELRDIKFLDLQNEIEIRNSKIYIPAMYIRSTAMSMLMSGTHSFENDIDYQFRINLMDVLSRKFRPGRVLLTDVEESGDGLINMYIAMTGTVDEPIFNTDKRMVKAKLYQDNKELNKGFMDVFKEEFIEEKETKKIDFRVRDNDDLEFLDWGDDTSSTTWNEPVEGFTPHTP